MMTDLISKSALLKRIGDEARNQAELYADRNNLVVLAYGDCYGKVQTAPTIDAVPVVRCKDCKYYREGEKLSPQKFCFRLRGRDGKAIGYNFAEDDFCSYGERSEDE